MNSRPDSTTHFLEKNNVYWLNGQKERKQAVQQFFQPRDYHQRILLTKLNIYLAQTKRPLLNIFPGYCHGLTLLWLYKMAEGEIQWFYNVIEKIISYPPSHLRSMDIDIEKFIKYIEWGQNSIKYTRYKEPCIYQSDVDKILGITQIEAQYKQFSFEDLYRFLQKRLYKNEMIVLSCMDHRVMHTIGVFVWGPLYFLYDSNYRSGRPTVFSSPLPLIHEIRQCMYTDFKKPLPIYYMPLETHVLNSLEVSKIKHLSHS